MPEREIVRKKYTTIRWGERSLSGESKRIQNKSERIVFWKKNYSCLFAQVRKNT